MFALSRRPAAGRLNSGVRQQMKITYAVTALFLLSTPFLESHARGKQKDMLCSEVKSFMASVEPDETRTLTLRTFWGAREEGDRIVMGSKSCEHNDYEPGKRLCSYLIQNSSTEFAGYDAKRILNCLAPKPGIAAELEIHSGSFSTTFGSPNRGALVDLELAPDKERGEMALRLQADGY
jgi:hypothetical protein